MLKIPTLDDLNMLLRGNRLYANGKNVVVDHLYATVAGSRFAHENLLGIYLTNARHAWMAVWMAVTNRAALKKRQLEYYAPDPAKQDFIGHLGIHNPDGNGLPPDVLCDDAYLNLFDLRAILLAEWSLETLSSELRLAALKGFGFEEGEVLLRNRLRRGLILKMAQGLPLLIHLDAWQSALINVPHLKPTVVVHLMPDVTRQLRQRIVSIPHAPGEDYIRPTLARLFLDLVPAYVGAGSQFFI